MQRLEQNGRAQLDTPPQVQPCLLSWSVRVAVVPPGDHWNDHHTGEDAKGVSPGSALLPLNPWAYRAPPSVSGFSVSEGDVGVQDEHASCSWSMAESFCFFKTPMKRCFSFFIPLCLLLCLPLL